MARGKDKRCTGSCQEETWWGKGRDGRERCLGHLHLTPGEGTEVPAVPGRAAVRVDLRELSKLLGRVGRRCDLLPAATGRRQKTPLGNGGGAVHESRGGEPLLGGLAGQEGVAHLSSCGVEKAFIVWCGKGARKELATCGDSGAHTCASSRWRWQHPWCGS